jgi:hypothetical protein
MAHPDLNKLLDTMLPLAKKLLGEFGDFLPYGAFMKLDGAIVDCGVSGKDEHPPSKELIEILTLDFQQRAAKGEIRAAGICCDVRVATPKHPEKVDAVQFALEHQNGEAVNVFLPYDLDSSGEVQYGELFAAKRERNFFQKQ